MTWPDGQRALKETARRASSVKRMREALRPLIRDFGERRLDTFGRDEALTWALAYGRNVQQSVRQFFNHATDRELIIGNPFACLGSSKRTRRVDRPDFELVSTEQYQRLCQCARASRTDNYGLIIEGAILAIGEAAIRPGEIFALHHTDLDYAENIINIRRQRDPSTPSMTAVPASTSKPSREWSVTTTAATSSPPSTPSSPSDEPEHALNARSTPTTNAFQP
jgi:integrase